MNLRSHNKILLFLLPSQPVAIAWSNCTCSDALDSWHREEFWPIRVGPAFSGDVVKNACVSIEALFGFGLKFGSDDCPQLLLSAAVACAEFASDMFAYSWRTANQEFRKGLVAELDLYMGLAYNKLIDAKKHCIDAWTSSGPPAVSVSEVLWNVDRYKQDVMRSVEFKLDFHWRRFSVPVYLLDEAVPLPELAPRGLLTSAANKWTYDGRGGDLGCGPRSHCYAPSLDRTLAPWFPLRRQNSPTPVSLLELGTCSGSSLAAWWEYLAARFSLATMIGIDSDLRDYYSNLGVFQKSGFVNSHRMIEADISTLGCGSELDVAMTTSAPFDIIVDDASHKDAEVQIAFERLFFDERLGLAPGGVYIVLDTQPQYRGKGSRLAFFKALADDAQWNGKAVVSKFNLDMYVAHTPDIVEAWVEVVEFHRGFVLIRKRAALGWNPIFMQ